MTVGITETSIVVFAMFSVLAYMSIEYKRLMNGIPMLLLMVSVMMTALWQMGVMSEDFMWGTLVLHGVGLGSIVVLEEVNW